MLVKNVAAQNFEFRTQSVDAYGDSISKWQSLVEPFANHIFEHATTNDKQFCGSFKLHSLPGMLLTKISVNLPITIERDLNKCIKDRFDHFEIHLCIKGSCTLSNGLLISSGDMFLTSMSEPRHLKSSAFECLTLIIAREYVFEIVELLDHFKNKRILPTEPLNMILSGQIKTFWGARNSITVTQSLNMLQSISVNLKSLIELHDNPEDIEKGDVISSIKEYIENNLESKLVVSEIASLHNISRAHLYRLFNSNSGIKGYIFARRLRRSYLHLATKQAPISMAFVAKKFGFSNKRSFELSFEKHFGFTAKSVVSFQSLDYETKNFQKNTIWVLLKNLGAPSLFHHS